MLALKMFLLHTNTLSKEKRSPEVYMRFVMENTNCLNQHVYRAIRAASGLYEIQLYPPVLTLQVEHCSNRVLNLVNITDKLL